MHLHTRNNRDSAVMQMGRRAGVGLHLTSLPGDHGVGDIAASATSFVDTLGEMGLGVWQFLPLGPTAYGDSPSQPLSAFAVRALSCRRETDAILARASPRKPMDSTSSSSSREDILLVA